MKHRLKWLWGKILGLSEGKRDKMVAGIVCVGNEVLDGVVQDTNSFWLINELKKMGIPVGEVFVVGDSVEAISKAIHRLIEDGVEIILTSGGLGPTHDDLTLRGVAAAFGRKMVLNEEALRIVERQYRVLHEKRLLGSPEMIESRKKMAYLPEGAEPLDNRVGGAPGVYLEEEGVCVIALPGVPKELKWIFENKVTPILRARSPWKIVEKTLVLSMRDESVLAPILEEAQRRFPGLYLKSLVKPYGEGNIRVLIRGGGCSAQQVEAQLDEAINYLQNRLNKIGRRDGS